MRVFVTGVAGQLGYDVANELCRRGYTVIGSDIAEGYSGAAPKGDWDYVNLNITDKSATESVISAVNPDAVIHCAAWTAVDAAEDTDNREKVWAVNVLGTESIAAAAKQAGSKLVYISTDYVFSGQGTEPWGADCRDFAPLNFYGESKLGGEKAVAEATDKFFIVRIAWVFGQNGNNFIKTMLNIGKKYDTLRVVCDQIGTPTYTPDLAVLLCDMIATEKYGYYNATNEGGFISWYDFACKIFEIAGYTTKVTPVTTEEYGVSKALRPKNSRLDKSKLSAAGFKPLPDWQDALERYLKLINN